MKAFFTPMLSLFLLSLGAAVLMTGQTVWLHRAHYSASFIGLITASYYIGFVYAAFRSVKLINRVSHIRAYSAFAALLTALVIIQGIITNPWFWIVIRLLSGYCIAGLFVVVESWLLRESHVKIRGQVLALYMIYFYAAQALGQFFLNLGVENILRLFAIAALSISLSILPLATTKLAQPNVEQPSIINFFKLFRLSPSGVTGSFISGLVLGPIYGLLPLYLASVQKQDSVIALSLATAIIGGMFFQVPFGKWSDHTDRRKVLAVVFTLLFLSALLLLFFNTSTTFRYVIFFLFGGASFAIYPLCMSHACDVLNVDDMVSAAQSLVLANGIGMVVGPLIASTAMAILSDKLGFAWYFIILSAIMTVFLFWRQIAGKIISVKQQQNFIVMPRASAINVEIDPRIDNDSSQQSSSSGTSLPRKW